MPPSIPRYSQYLDVRMRGWKSRSCGVVALKMIIDCYIPRAQRLSADDLIALGLAREAYIPGVGWKHHGLVKLAEEFGLRGKNYDWASSTSDAALKKMHRYASLPFLASVYKHFDPKNGGHLIVVTKVDRNAISYHEPASHIRGEIQKTVTLSLFLRGWKKRVIVVAPKIAKRKGR
jgi:hypothetical protein